MGDFVWVVCEGAISESDHRLKIVRRGRGLVPFQDLEILYSRRPHCSAGRSRRRGYEDDVVSGRLGRQLRRDLSFKIRLGSVTVMDDETGRCGRLTSGSTCIAASSSVVSRGSSEPGSTDPCAFCVEDESRGQSVQVNKTRGRPE